MPRSPIALVLLPLLIGCQPAGIRTGDGRLIWEVDDDAGPIPYGFWGLNGYISEEGLQDVQERFGVSIFHTSTRHPNYATTDLLPLVRESGLRVNLRLTGDHSHYITPTGDFDLDAWMDMLDPWADSGVQEFIDDGTLASHMLLDDIGNFAGVPPDAETLEAMAEYSKALLPGLKVLVRERATELPWPESGRYVHVDGAINQYRALDGDVETYALAEAERAELLELDIVNGLNIADGGDGSSGQPGWTEGSFAMSAEEITRYGTVLSGIPGCTMFLNWEYDGEERWSDGSLGSDYFDQDDLQAALLGISLRLAGEDTAR
jgi:hypothetical protein